jgi:hypothetical protein
LASRNSGYVRRIERKRTGEIQFIKFNDNVIVYDCSTIIDVFQEIRDREQAIIQLSLEQNHQRVQLKQWEQELLEREMHLVECELKLVMTSINQERVHQHQTPKVQKRSGRFMRSFLNGNPSLSPTANDFISNPTSTILNELNSMKIVNLLFV